MMSEIGNMKDMIEAMTKEEVSSVLSSVPSWMLFRELEIRNNKLEKMVSEVKNAVMEGKRGETAQKTYT